ncbi:MAG: hypothetical protein F6K41_33840 [Symploca sp. SIO3E6]|nr:hypothetical protein [Caldora sp. SIO3E6]
MFNNELPGINTPLRKDFAYKPPLPLHPLSTKKIPIKQTRFEIEYYDEDIVRRAKIANKVTWARVMQEKYGPIAAKSRWGKQLIKEALKQNFFDELLALWNIGNPENSFGYARTQLFEAISKVILYGDDYPPEVSQEITDAGHLLYQVDGMRGLQDILVWSFIPRSIQREVDNCFNGIGEWLS